MNTLLALVYLLIFPGFLFLFSFSLFTEYLDRKVYARIQRRVGPPFLQPFADLVKLAAKEDVIPEKADHFMFTAAPLLGLVAVFAAFLYLPIVSNSGLHSFNGDLIVVLYLLTIPTLALFLGGWYSGNVFGQKGGMRGASLLFSYEIPFFLSLLTPALIQGSWKMTNIIIFESTHPVVLLISLLGFVIALLSLQGKLERLPFDIPEAETEIVAGPLVEYSGRRLALFRLGRDTEMVVGAGLIAVVFLAGPMPLIDIEPIYLSWICAAIVFLLKTLFVIFLLILIKSAVARIRTDQMISLAYKWLIPLTLVQIFIALMVQSSEVSSMKVPGKMLPKIIGFIIQKPVTVLYPKERLIQPETLRGKMKFHLDRCISCGLCARDCPSAACTMHEIDGKKRPVFDLDFCTFCAQCAESCPKDAIEMTSEFELAHYTKGEAIVK